MIFHGFRPEEVQPERIPVGTLCVWDEVEMVDEVSSRYSEYRDEKEFKREYLMATDIMFDEDTKIIEAVILALLGDEITEENRVKGREGNDMRMQACMRCPVACLAIWGEVGI